MSDPTSNTVRGWQVLLIAALQGLGGNTELLAEMRYISRRLFGIDSTGTALPVEQRPSIRDALIFQQESEFGDPVRRPIAQLLGELFTAETLLNPIQYLSVLDTPLSTLGSLLVDPSSDDSVGKSAAQTNASLSQIKDFLGPNTSSGGLNAIADDIRTAIGILGQNGGPLTVREYLAGILVQATRQADCCEESNGGNGTPPAFSSAVCSSHPLLTATYTFSGEITASGAVASGLVLNGSPPNFTTDSGDSLTGPLLQYTASSIGTCWYIAVDPAYTGNVSANITLYALPTYSTDTGRSDAPDLSPGPETFTVFADTVPDNEVGMAYGVGIGIGPTDPPLQGSQVVVYVGRPDPNA